MDRSYAPLQQFPINEPMERVVVDILGPFPRSDKENRYVLVALYYFTKSPEAYALPDLEEETVAEAMLEAFFSQIGVPQELHTDQGRNFKSRVFTEVPTAGHWENVDDPLHLQSDGLVK